MHSFKVTALQLMLTSRIVVFVVRSAVLWTRLNLAIESNEFFCLSTNRETICRNPWLNKCDTLGLAELGTSKYFSVLYCY